MALPGNREYAIHPGQPADRDRYAPRARTYFSYRGSPDAKAFPRLFSFRLDLASEKDSISFKDIIGQNVTIRTTLADSSARYFNGFVSRFAQSGSDARFTHYQMEVVPWLWFLTRIADCRIFQEKTIPAIIQDVFKSRGFTRLQTKPDCALMIHVSTASNTAKLTSTSSPVSWSSTASSISSSMRTASTPWCLPIPERSSTLPGPGNRSLRPWYRRRAG